MQTLSIPTGYILDRDFFWRFLADACENGKTISDTRPGKLVDITIPGHEPTTNDDPFSRCDYTYQPHGRTATGEGISERNIFVAHLTLSGKSIVGSDTSHLWFKSGIEVAYDPATLQGRIYYPAKPTGLIVSQIDPDNGQVEKDIYYCMPERKNRLYCDGDPWKLSEKYPGDLDGYLKEVRELFRTGNLCINYCLEKIGVEGIFIQ